MRRVGLLLALLLSALAGCADPVTNEIGFGELLGSRTANVTSLVPRTHADLEERVAETGYEPDPEMKRCVGNGAEDCDIHWSPETPIPPTTNERLYFSKAFVEKYNATVYGLLVDVDRNGLVLHAIGFKQLSLVF